jgi:hypothetical protein
MTLGVMAGHSASQTRVHALLCRPSTSYFFAALKTWMPAFAGMTMEHSEAKLRMCEQFARNDKPRWLWLHRAS